jgi:hypothetical protein
MVAHDHLHRHRARDSDNFWNEVVKGASAALHDLPGIFADSEPTTITHTVTATMSPTSTTGSISRWVIVTKQPDTKTKSTSTSTSTSTPKETTSLVVDTSKKTSTKEAAKTSSSTTLPVSIAPPTTSAAAIDGNGLVAATSSIPSVSTPTVASESSSITPVAKSTSSGGMSAGGEAGLAIGILLLVGTIAGLVFFCIRKRRAAKQEQLDDEKSEVWGGAERQISMRTAVNAPRLSLRPITQFLPNRGGEKRQSQGNALAMASAGAAAGAAAGTKNAPRYSWEAPVGGNEGNKHNPFGNHAETIDSNNANGPPVVSVVSPSGEVITSATVGAAAGLTRGASKRENALQADGLHHQEPPPPTPKPCGHRVQHVVRAQWTTSPYRNWCSDRRGGWTTQQHCSPCST